MEVFPRNLNKLWNKKVLRIYLAFQLVKSLRVQKAIGYSYFDNISNDYNYSVIDTVINSVSFNKHIRRKLKVPLKPVLVFTVIVADLKLNIARKTIQKRISKEGTYEILLQSDKKYNRILFMIEPFGFSKIIDFSKPSNLFKAVVTISNMKVTKDNSGFYIVEYDIDVVIFEYKPKKEEKEKNNGSEIVCE